jgi:enamine deaminase RidA (YjgF/YER057c/UK114 family)
MPSREVWVDGWGFVSGVGPVDLENAAVALPESVEEQTRRILSNLESILNKRGLSREHVVAVRIHLIEFKRFYERMTRAYTGFFSGARPPAHSCIGVSALTRGALIEMDFIVKEPS